jgi:hypothetical protein
MILEIILILAAIIVPATIVFLWPFMFKPTIVRIENKLEQMGYREQTQKFRLLQLYWGQGGPEVDQQGEWAFAVIRSEMRLREIVQREAWLLEEYQELEQQENKTSDERTRLECCKTGLNDIHAKYWRQERRHYAIESSCVLGPLNRAYRSCRRDSRWHLTYWLRQDCASPRGMLWSRLWVLRKAAEHIPRDALWALYGRVCVLSAGPWT